MNKKLPFWILVIEALICFIPIIILWVLAVVKTGNNLLKNPEGFSSNDIFYRFPLVMGGFGIYGIFQIINHIKNQEPIKLVTKINLILGFTGLFILDLYLFPSIFSSTLTFNPYSLIFILPFICIFHLLYIAKN